MYMSAYEIVMICIASVTLLLKLIEAIFESAEKNQVVAFDENK